MHSWSDLFERKAFGAFFTGGIAFSTAAAGVHDWRLLALPLLAVAAYWSAIQEPAGPDHRD